MQDLHDKVALVTGAARGIGRASAARLAQDGAAVMLVDRDERALEVAASELRSDGVDVAAAAVDVTVASTVDELMERTVASLGGLDVLVNCAGIQRYGTVVDTSEELWDEVMAVNVRSGFLMSRGAIPLMRARGGGSIVNVSSAQAVAAQQNAAAYVASKGAVNALTRAMAVDHAAECIRVNAVCPASVDTPMLRWAAGHLANGDGAEQLLRDWGAMHPIGRVGAPAEVAELIAFLAGPRAAFITGADYRVDGGLLAALGVATGGAA
ncbi:MAG TPA: glucose 1-dehydrogenase [Solirubrobacteraceae bacterium]|nr:glucose 1-dehydrogenase [Solirubrobacteraceae bacterium]